MAVPTAAASIRWRFKRDAATGAVLTDPATGKPLMCVCALDE